MISKANQQKIILVLIYVGSFSLLFSCSEFLKGKPEKKETIEIKKETLSCLKNVAPDLKKLLDSNADQEKIDEAFACLDKTLDEFQNKAEGKADKNSFNADELYQIFDKFVNDAKISREATEDLLNLKAALAGGSKESLTKPEIQELRTELKSLQVEIKKLQPYMELFLFKKTDKPLTKEFIKEGFAQLNASLKTLLKASEISKSEYQFDDFKQLLTNLDVLNDEQKKLIDLALKVKDLLSGQLLVKSEADRSLFIDNITEVLTLYSIQTQGYIKFEISDETVLQDTLGYIQSWLNLLENSIQFVKTKTIPSESLDPLLTELLNRKLLPINVSPDALIKFYKKILVRVFEAGPTGSLNEFSGIKKVHFNNLRKELALYRMYQRFIDKTTGAEVRARLKKERLAISEVQTQLRNFKAEEQTDILGGLEETDKKLIISQFNELKEEFLSSRPVIYRFKKMIIAVNQEIWDQNWEDLARGLYVKLLSRGLMLGWGNASATKLMTNAFVNEANLVQWYDEFKQFGEETKSFDPRAKNSGARSLKEANLFAYSGNGDQKMTFTEAIQYLNMLVSGGGQSFNEIREGLEKANCNLAEKDAFDYKWNNEVCSTKELRQSFKYYFSNLSYLVGYVEKLNDQQFNEFYQNLMEVARTDAKNKGKIETSDIRTMIILLHYIESVYAQFDTNRNWLFSAAEIRFAYPRFNSFAHDYAYKNAKEQIAEFNGLLANTIGGYWCYSEEDLIRESFIFLVYNGRTPKKADLTTAPCFGLSASPLIRFNGEVDRKTIINTFKILKAVLGS